MATLGSEIDRLKRLTVRSPVLLGVMTSVNYYSLFTDNEKIELAILHQACYRLLVSVDRNMGGHVFVGSGFWDRVSPRLLMVHIHGWEDGL